MNVYLQSLLAIYIVHSVPTIYKNIFTVPRPRPRPRPPPPISAFVECDGSTGRSPANKNPSVSSGTCPAGDRPVIQTESSPTASGSHPSSRSSWHGSTG